MIFTLVFILILIISIIMIYKGEKFNNRNETMLYVGILLVTLSTAALFVLTVIIVTSHIGTKQIITENQIEYESLCKRLEIVNSDYEDVSKSEVIKDITEWNIMVSKEKYWTYNPWTSWFHNRKVTDNLEYIERSEYLELKR